MKRKGISLIVLIITIVVIIILAASIILNMSKINIINNANAAVLKQDIATLQSELDLYKSDKFVDKKGKYDATKLNADTSKATYGTESIEDKNSDGNSNIHDILTSLKKSRYKDNVYIQEGRLVFKKSGLKDEEVEIILEMGLEVDGMPKVTSIETNSEYTSIEVALNITLAEEVEKVIYILNDGEREESKELTKTYTGLTQGVNYTLEVILVLKDGTEISRKEIISTKSINGQLKYTLSENDWTNKDVTVTIEYSEAEMPEGYELQYKLIGNMTKDWTKYTGAITVSENNTTVVGRIYNASLDDEYVDGSSKEVSKIDKVAPTAPTELTLTVDGTTITATASGSIDVGSGIYKYMYSLDNITWQESNEFKNLKSETEYTVYTKSIDTAGNESTIIQEKATIAKVYEIVFNNINGTKNTTIDGKDFAYNNPVVPVGFMAVNTTDAKWTEENGWNNGLVIADAKGNEFVWVPCTIDGANGTIKYKKWCTKGIAYNDNKLSDDTAALPMKDETTRVTETEQITKYGGFYIGRYEAGTPGKTGNPSDSIGVPTIQQGATVWVSISYTNANDSAKSLVNTANVKSGLVTGTQWDTVCAWIQSETDLEGKLIYDVTNSRNWGNYSDSLTPANIKGYGTKQSAGYSEYWKAKNIYDLAGNTNEWTGEISYTARVFRGGAFGAKGYISPASERSRSGAGGAGVSFRVVLYVM